MARPSKFTPILVRRICDRIAGGASLRAICEGEGMPNRETVRRWLRDNDEFRRWHALAREWQAEFYADQIIEIADGVAANRGAIQRARLRIDARKWIASKLAPKRYGHRPEIDGGLTVKRAIGGDSGLGHALSGLDGDKSFSEAA